MYVEQGTSPRGYITDDDDNGLVFVENDPGTNNKVNCQNLIFPLRGTACPLAGYMFGSLELPGRKTFVYMMRTLFRIVEEIEGGF